MRHHVADEGHVAWADFRRGHHGTGHARLGFELSLDLSEFDAVAPDLHLEVHAPQVFQLPVFAPAAQVPGSVDALRRARAPRERHEAVRGEVGSSVVSQGDAITPDADLAFLANRDRLHGLVQDPDLGVVDRAADGDLGVGVAHGRQRGPHRGFRGAVHVPDFDAFGQQSGGKCRWQGLATDQGAQATGWLPARVQQQVPGGGRGLHHGDLMLRDQRHQRFTVHGFIARGEHHGAASAQREQQFQHRDVEAQGGHRQQSIARLETRFPLHAAQEIADRAVLHGHALGPSRGARGVDHVGGRLRVGQGGQGGVAGRGHDGGIVVKPQLCGAWQAAGVGAA